jgi:hypothetical protein
VQERVRQMALAGVDAVIVQVRQPAAPPRCLLLAA